MATLSESAFPQPDRYPDRVTVSAPIALKLPVHFQLEVIPTSYGCEVIVPVLLKIPIAIQLDILQKPPLCQPQTPEPLISFTESAQALNEYSLESMERRSEASSTADSSSSEPLTAEPLPIAIDICQPSNRFSFKKLHQLGAKLYRLFPMTVLAILLGSLLGAGCSSFLIKYLVELNIDRKISTVSIVGEQKSVSKNEDNDESSVAIAVLTSLPGFSAITH